MSELKLFIDGSVNTRSKLGYGAYLAVTETGLPLDSLKNSVKLKQFENTSSTKLELQTLLWALDEIWESEKKVIVYTDSQNIMELPGRRVQLEKNNYFSRKNTRLNNYELYKEFFRKMDQLNFELVKVRGHQPSKNKNELDRLFTLVDRASRNALRNKE